MVCEQEASADAHALVSGKMPASPIGRPLAIAPSIRSQTMNSSASSSSLSTSMSASIAQRANHLGKWAGIGVVAWSVGISLCRSSLDPVVFWTLLVFGGAVIASLPGWFLGKNVRRAMLAERSQADSSQG